jgi:hypothetical protein
VDISDKLNELKRKAQDAAVEHKDQINEAVEKAQAAADQRTAGKYHDRIAKAGAKVKGYVENLNPEGEGGAPPAAGE